MQHLKGLYLFFIGSLFIVCTYFLPHWFTLSPKKTIQLFQEKIEHAEQELKDDLYVLKELFQTNQLFRKEALFQKEHTSFFVFKRDSLLFWSDNKSNFNRAELLNKEAILFTESNGVFLKQHRRENGYYFIALRKIKHKYIIQNQFLTNKFAKDFRFSTVNNISADTGEAEIYSSQKKILFYLQLKKGEPSNTVVLFFGFVFLVGCYFLLFLLPLAWKKNYFILSYLAIALRVILFISLPDVFRGLKIFQAEYFAIHKLTPSLGDLLLHLIVLFILLYQLERYLRTSKSKWVAMLVLIITSFLGIFFIFLIEKSIQSSLINYDISNLFLLDYLSLFAFITFAISTLNISILIHLSVTLLKPFFSLKTLQLFLLSVFALIFGLGYSYFNFTLIHIWHLPVFLFFIYKAYNTKKRFILLYILFLFFVSGVISYEIGVVSEKKANSKQKSLALKLAEERDPIAEHLFNELQVKLLNDSFLYKNSKNYWLNKEEIDYYLNHTYFNGYWKKYQTNLFLCSEVDKLEFANSSSSCIDYFQSRIQSEGDMVSSNNLFQLTNYAGRIDYIGDIQYKVNNTPFHLFVELSSIYLNENEGYPELLLDQQSKNESIDLASFGYAVYNKNELLYKNDTYNYSTYLPTNELSPNSFFSYQTKDYQHLVYQKDKEVAIVISRKKSSLFDFLTELAYMVVLVSLITTATAIFLTHFPFHFAINIHDFSTKIQLFLVGSLIGSLLLLIWGTTFYIQRQYQIKNENALAEKIRSINLELESKLKSEEFLSNELQNYVSSYLVKFSNVFYSDINLYNQHGELYATSRPELFSKGIQSSRMEPHAFHKLAVANKSEWIQQEKIGNLNYISAYIPFKNYNNEVLGYLNLPYFAKQGELEEEISTFLVSTLNIYVGIFVVALLISVLLVNQLSKPLLLIRQQISKLKLGSSIELIKWQSNDEIGALVNEYNRIAIDLNESAEALAKSEREVAWREMAKQVAHEIKNPLTPMKLSIQHLQMAAHTKSNDLEERINKITKTLIEQIEALSDIATAFSSFAQLPSKEFKELTILPILMNAIHLYSHDVPITFNEPEGASKWKVKGDKDQLLRVFNNLIKNAVQAVEKVEEPNIQVLLKEDNQFYIIQVIDNGIGISDVAAERIFEPNFTTKTSGSGLGLAMSKNIINQMTGNISFHSVESNGTTFKIELRKA